MTNIAIEPAPVGALASKAWEMPIYAVEPMPPVPPPRPRTDHSQLRAQLEQEMLGAQADLPIAEIGARAMRHAHRSASRSFQFGIYASIAVLIVAGISALLPGIAEFLAIVIVPVIIIVLFGPWLAASAYVHRRELSGDIASLRAWGIGLWIVAALLAFPTVGLSLTLLPLAMGYWALNSKPRLWEPMVRQAVRSPRTLDELHRDYDANLRSLRALASDYQPRLQAVINEDEARYQEYLNLRQQRADSWRPHRLVPFPEQKNVVIVGGSPAERGDLLHHLVAASRSTSSTRLWVLDLEGRGVAERFRVESLARSESPTWLEGDDEEALELLIDELSQLSGGRHSPFINTLAEALAYDAAQTLGRAREVADVLHRIRKALVDADERPSVRSLHAALALLEGTTTVTRRESIVDDDFGLSADSVSGDTGDRFELSAAAIKAIRAEFVDTERSNYFSLWTDIRVKLGTLLIQDDTRGHSVDAARYLDPDGDIRLATVPMTMSRSDRDFRAALLAAHHLELARTTPDKPEVIIINGAEALPVNLIADLIKTAQGLGILTVAIFSEYTAGVEEVTKTRHIFGAFGGQGEREGEKLAEMFGKDWVSRVASYQTSFSEADTRSRAIAAGRSWSDTDTRTWSDTYDPKTGFFIFGPELQSYSDGGSQSNTIGGSRTSTDTTGTTSTRGSTESVSVEYENQVTGSYLRALPPYMLIMKDADRVATLDVFGQLVVKAYDSPEQERGVAEAFVELEEHPASVPGTVPAMTRGAIDPLVSLGQAVHERQQRQEAAAGGQPQPNPAQQYPRSQPYGGPQHPPGQFPPPPHGN